MYRLMRSQPVLTGWRGLLHVHLWRAVRDTGLTRYEACRCGARRAEQYSDLYQPFDSQWVLTGKWTKPGTPYSTSDITGVADPEAGLGSLMLRGSLEPCGDGSEPQGAPGNRTGLFGWLRQITDRAALRMAAELARQATESFTPRKVERIPPTGGSSVQPPTHLGPRLCPAVDPETLREAGEIAREVSERLGRLNP